MDILDDVCTDPVTYWEPTGGTGPDGQPTYKDPVQIYVFWMDINEIFTNAKGQEQRSLSKVLTRVDVVVDGVLWHGRLANATNLQKPFANNNPKAHAIARFDKIPTIDQDDFARTAYL